MTGRSRIQYYYALIQIFFCFVTCIFHIALHIFRTLKPDQLRQLGNANMFDLKPFVNNGSINDALLRQYGFRQGRKNAAAVLFINLSIFVFTEA